MELSWLAITPVNAGQLLWDITVRGTADGKPITDRIKFTQQIVPAIKVEPCNDLLQLDQIATST